MSGEQPPPEVATSAEAMEAAVLPEARVVHATPGPATPEERPLPPGVARRPAAEKSPAEWAYERLILYLQDFEARLDADHEVALGLVGGEMGVMRIEGIGFFAPDLITFYGSDEAGNRSQLVQHVHQLNVMLRAVPRPPERPEPMRIGFRLARALDKPPGDG